MEKIIVLASTEKTPNEYANENTMVSFGSRAELLAERAVSYHFSNRRHTDEYCVGGYDSGLSQICKFESDKVDVEINSTCHYGRKPDTLTIRVKGYDEKIVSEVVDIIMAGHYGCSQWGGGYSFFSIQEALERGVLKMEEPVQPSA